MTQRKRRSIHVYHPFVVQCRVHCSQSYRKGVLVVTRVAAVSTITTTAAVAAAVVDEAKIAARQLEDDPHVKTCMESGKAGYTASMTYARNKAAAIEAAATDFADRHR